MSEQLNTHIAGQRREIEDALHARLPLTSLPAARSLNEALAYAVFPGGKRLRPALALLASDLVGVPRTQGLHVACAVEFLHSSSLILDDLPAMDDAHLRRNRRALHLVYGEGVATLAAVALLNQSYALLAQAGGACGHGGAVESLIGEATRAVGADGMIGGQVVDLLTQAGGEDDAEQLASRDLKTVALMRLMMIGGALACGAEDTERRSLAEFGVCFGRAYQICDDLLDDSCESDSLTGKPAGQDARHARATAVNTLGAEQARRMAARLVERGTSRLFAQFGERTETRLLADAARLCLERVKVVEASNTAPPSHVALSSRAAR